MAAAPTSELTGLSPDSSAVLPSGLEREDGKRGTRPMTPRRLFAVELLSSPEPSPKLGAAAAATHDLQHRSCETNSVAGSRAAVRGEKTPTHPEMLSGKKEMRGKLSSHGVYGDDMGRSHAGPGAAFRPSGLYRSGGTALKCHRLKGGEAETGGSLLSATCASTTFPPHRLESEVAHADDSAISLQQAPNGLQRHSSRHRERRSTMLLHSVSLQRQTGASTAVEKSEASTPCARPTTTRGSEQSRADQCDSVPQGSLLTNVGPTTTTRPEGLFSVNWKNGSTPSDLQCSFPFNRNSDSCDTGVGCFSVPTITANCLSPGNVPVISSTVPQDVPLYPRSNEALSPGYTAEDWKRMDLVQPENDIAGQAVTSLFYQGADACCFLSPYCERCPTSQQKLALAEAMNTPGGLSASHSALSGRWPIAPSSSSSPAAHTMSPSAIGSPSADSPGTLPLEQLLDHISKADAVQLLLELSSCSAETMFYVKFRAQMLAAQQDSGIASATPIVASYSGPKSTSDAAVCRSDATNNVRLETGGLTESTMPCGKFMNDKGLLPLDEAAVSISDRLRKDQWMTAAAGSSPCYLSVPQSGTGAAHFNPIPAKVNQAVFHTAQEFSTATEVPAAGLLSPLSRSCAGTKSPEHCTEELDISSEERCFSSDAHPCLRWFGACRNASSCVFIQLPRNICLNWIHSRCTDGQRCAGVHRLPLNYSPQVELIFQLYRGLGRREVAAIVAGPEKDSSPLSSTKPRGGDEGRAEVVARVRNSGLPPSTPVNQSIVVDTTPLSCARRRCCDAREVSVVSPNEGVTCRSQAGGASGGGDRSIDNKLCGTLGTSPHVNEVERCLQKDFEAAASHEVVDGVVPSSLDMNQTDWRRDSTTGEKSAVTLISSALFVAPLLKGDGYGDSDEDYCDLATPSGSSKTRTHSPLFSTESLEVRKR